MSDESRQQDEQRKCVRRHKRFIRHIRGYGTQEAFFEKCTAAAISLVHLAKRDRASILEYARNLDQDKQTGTHHYDRAEKTLRGLTRFEPLTHSTVASICPTLHEEGYEMELVGEAIEELIPPEHSSEDGKSVDRSDCCTYFPICSAVYNYLVNTLKEEHLPTFRVLELSLFFGDLQIITEQYQAQCAFLKERGFRRLPAHGPLDLFTDNQPNPEL